MTPSLKRSYSPTRLAFRRLSQNRLAMLGLVLLLAVIIFVVTGTVWVDTDPSETRIWIGTRGPGFKHPFCRSETHFQKGEEPNLEPVLLGNDLLAYDVKRIERVEYRVVIRRQKVASIARGGEPQSVLDLSSLASPARESLMGDEWGRVLPPVKIKVGHPAPEGLLAKGQRVLILGWERTGQSKTVKVSLSHGKVTKIMDGTTSVNRLTVRGPDVQVVRGDGKVLTLFHPLGTDESGRDLFLRIVKGGQISLLVGLVATAVSLFMGVIYGATAGYLGGKPDALMMRFVDILYGLPFIFLVLLLMVVFDRNIILLFVALGMVQWLTMARIVRGQVLSLRGREFVQAARMSGAGDLKIIFLHLIPHTVGPVIVYATLTVPVVILEESFLAFIGLPVQYQGTTLDSWGSLVNLGMNALGEGGQNWWLLVFPSMAMVLTLFGLNCLGDGLRDSFDPRGE